MPSPVVLILGAGPRIGSAVAEKFSANGYRVALTSRRGKSETKADSGVLLLQGDLAKVETIPSLFEAVKAEFQSPPSVIIYNAGSLTMPSEEGNPLSIAVVDVQKDLVINTVAPYVAAQEAVKAWKDLPGDVKKSFIYTGNITNTMVLPVPMMVNVGMGKSASAYWIGTTDAAYKDHGMRFYYADERHADGRLKGLQLDGAAHADFYLQLAVHEGNVPWHAPFVKGQGYTKF